MSGERMDPVVEEQQFVNTAYKRLDELRASYQKRLADIRKGEKTSRSEELNPEELFQRDSMVADYEDQIARLARVEHQLVLGRLDAESGDVEHIGRIGLRDQDRNILLLDWRASQAAPFYQATALSPQGMVRRRHIQTRLRQVVSVEDELLTSDAEATKDLNLTGEGALLAALGRARTDKMTDIVATIQAEQDRIIRDSTDGVLVVQGGPGTGKTAVALHRAAYLLYAERQRLARSGVLIIGPSPAFLSYISQVLPSLGESDVVSSTIENLIPGITPTGVDTDEVVAIKGNSAWAAICHRAVDYLRRPLRSRATARINSTTVTVTPHMVERAQKRALRAELPHNEAWKIYAESMVSAIVDEYCRVTETSPDEWLTADVASNAEVRRIVNLHWLPATPTWLLAHLLAHRELLTKLAPELTDNEIALLARERFSQVTGADIPILDELAELLGEIPVETHSESDTQYANDTIENMGVGGGIVTGAMLAARHEDRTVAPLAERAAHDRTWVYGHVVVDEAQELSPMAWRMIARRCPSRSLTIVGDLDQRPAGPPAGGWPELLGSLASHLRREVLTISYRTPKTVLDKADDAMEARGITLQHPAEAVRDVPGSYRHAPLAQALAEENAFLDELYGPDQGVIAVIAENPPTIDDPRVRTMTPREAKGLEFDSVILLGDFTQPGDLYVAMTRPTQHLVIAEES